MRSIVFEDNSNSLRYWIYTLIITTYCVNKRGFDCALWRAIARCLFADSLLPLAPFFSLFLLHITQAPYGFFFLFFLVPHQVSNHLPFAYLSLTSLSSTPLHYEVQLRICTRKIIFILLHSFTLPKIYITIELFLCLKHVSRCTKTRIACFYH